MPPIGRFSVGLTVALFAVAVCRAADMAQGEIDMFAAPGAVTWKHFSEKPLGQRDEVWQLRDGVMVCKGTPRGYLYTEQKFTNFVLKLQWRWPEGKPGNGGVLIRMTGEHKIWPKSLEAQINAGDAGDFWGLDGFRLDGPADRKKELDNPQFGKLINLKKTAAAEKPAGQWNDYVIEANGDTVTLTINGKTVNRATGCDVVAGPILLTAEGDEIHFRNMRITPIAKPDK